jgi:hypothetical protein
MIRVVVDTNILRRREEPPLGGIDMRRLLDESRRGILELVLPEIVVREAANQWAELVVEKAERYEDARAFLVRAGVLADDGPTELHKMEIRAEAEARIRDLVIDSGGRIQALPAVGHDEVVGRALRREQPFDKKGHDGYRDVILWETVLEMASESAPLVFISADRRAFFDGDFETGLSKKLADEFEARAKGGATIDLCRDVDAGLAVVRETVADEDKRMAMLIEQERANLELLARMNDLVGSDMVFAGKLYEAVEVALTTWDLGQDLRGYGIADSDVWGAHVEVVDSVSRVQFAYVYELEDGEVLAHLSAAVEVSAAVTLDPGAAMLLDEHPQVKIRDIGFISKVAEGQAELAARVMLEVVVDPAGPDLTGPATVTGVEPLSAGEYLDLD